MSSPADIQHYLRPGLLQLKSLPPLSLYVHLPWCLKKCPYCDFNSHEVRGEQVVRWAGDGVTQPEAAPAGPPEQRYIDALMADLEAALPLVWGRTVHSIFIGGGYTVVEAIGEARRGDGGAAGRQRDEFVVEGCGLEVDSDICGRRRG